MRYLILSLILIVNSESLLCQQKYFANKYEFGTIAPGGLEIIPFENKLQVAGNNVIENSNGDSVWETFVTNVNTMGYIEYHKTYSYIDESSLSLNWFPKHLLRTGEASSVLCGRRETIAGQSEYYFHSYLMFLNEQTDSTHLIEYKYQNYNTSGYSCCLSTDNMLVMAGKTRINDSSTPFITKINDQGEVQWEYTYEVVSEGSDWFKSIVLAPDGGYYTAGPVNYGQGQATEDLNFMVLKVDSDGLEEYRRIVDFGLGSSVQDIIVTEDGRIVLSLIVQYYLEGIGSEIIRKGMLLKLNPDFSTAWTIELVHDQAVQSVIELDDGSLVACGSHKFPDGTVDLAIAKVAADGSEMLWRRTYGGSLSDYAYDICASPDGGFALTGRTDSIPNDYMYVVKTNCMGLLSLPEVDFEYHHAYQNELLVNFVNQSQYVYPDSIDGGRFIWDFGDGTFSIEQNPSHQFEADGYYTVNLTAIVCNDTSTYSQDVLVYPLGLEGEIAIFKNQLSVFPNPVQGQSFISFDLDPGVDFTACTIKVYSILGELVATYPLSALSGKVEVNGADFAAGLYFISLEYNTVVLAESKLEILF